MSSQWPPGKMCDGCAGRAGTEAHQTVETQKALADCISTGKPFYCHESIAIRDPNGWLQDKAGDTYAALPESRWRLCRAWTNAIRQKA